MISCTFFCFFLLLLHIDHGRRSLGDAEQIPVDRAFGGGSRNDHRTVWESKNDVSSVRSGELMSTNRCSMEQVSEDSCDGDEKRRV